MDHLLTRLWAELQRRRVIRSAAAYAAASFILLQLGEILLPAYADDAPDVLRALFAVISAGFPVVLALSWVYDIRSGRLGRTAPIDAPADGAPVTVRTSKTSAVWVVAIAAGLGALAWWLVEGGPSLTTRLVRPPWIVASAVVLVTTGWWAVRGIEPDVGSRASIAVLPFADWSSSSDPQQFGKALADEVLNLLASAEGVQVVARISSFALGDSPGDARGVGDRLSVCKVLEGSISRHENRIRVTAQLIDTRSGFHLWSKTYRHEIEDWLLAQDELARKIVQDIVGSMERPGPLLVG